MVDEKNNKRTSIKSRTIELFPWIENVMKNPVQQSCSFIQ